MSTNYYGTGNNSPLNTCQLICEDCAARLGIPIFSGYHVKAACAYCRAVKPVVMVDTTNYIKVRMRAILGNDDLSQVYLERVLREADRQGLSQHPELKELLGDIRQLLRQRT